MPMTESNAVTKRFFANRTNDALHLIDEFASESRLLRVNAKTQRRLTGEQQMQIGRGVRRLLK